ncbi:MAG: hypothetical protein ABS949_10100 [Solibacillus sp.]
MTFQEKNPYYEYFNVTSIEQLEQCFIQVNEEMAQLNTTEEFEMAS